MMIICRKSPKPEKAGKKPRTWELGGTNKDLVNLERTTDRPEDAVNNIQTDTTVRMITILVGDKGAKIFCANIDFEMYR